MQPPAVSLPQEEYIHPLENRAIQLWQNILLSVAKPSATMSPTSSVNGTSPTVRSDAAYPASRMGRDGHERAKEWEGQQSSDLFSLRGIGSIVFIPPDTHAFAEERQYDTSAVVSL